MTITNIGVGLIQVTLSNPFGMDALILYSSIEKWLKEHNIVPKTVSGYTNRFYLYGEDAAAFRLAFG
jgi:hypothetical protein